MVMVNLGLILQHDGIYGIMCFVMADLGFMKFAMAYKELAHFPMCGMQLSIFSKKI